MIGLRSRAVKFALLAQVVLSACTEPAPSTPRGPVFDAPAAEVELEVRLGPGQHGIVGAGPARLAAPRIADLEDAPLRASMVGEDSIMLQLTEPLQDATYAEDGGEAIDEALEAFSQREIRTYGAGLMTAVQLFGDPFHTAICHPPELYVSLDGADGQTWEAALEVPQYTPFIGDLEAPMSALSSDCRDGLAEAGGDIEAAVDARDCSVDEQHQFFEQGSACLACVEGNAGDFASCVDEDACTEEAPQVTWVLEDGEKAWYQLVVATAWACRPDWLALVYLLAHVPADGTLPESYDHANWNYYCFPLYDPTTDSLGYTCDAGDSPERGHTLGEGLIGRTLWMENDAGEVAYSQREYFTPQVDLKGGARLRWSWANSSNIGRLSKPFALEDSNGDGEVGPDDEGWGYASDSWGINPHALRPGGTDPSSLDDTLARDWLALLALKTATTMNGISISTFNFSRCAAWEGPDEEGRYRCTAASAPTGGWLNDALHYGVLLGDGQRYSYPLPVTTIGSTGLADPEVPGGIVPLIAGSDRLAEQEWEDCVWPHSFVVDQIQFPDTPWDYEGSASVWGDTYRFGKDADLDLRMALSTNLARHYCPEGE